MRGCRVDVTAGPRLCRGVVNTWTARPRLCRGVVNTWTARPRLCRGVVNTWTACPRLCRGVVNTRGRGVAVASWARRSRAPPVGQARDRPGLFYALPPLAGPNPPPSRREDVRVRSDERRV